jgi:hypothetical protein
MSPGAYVPTISIIEEVLGLFPPFFNTPNVGVRGILLVLTTSVIVVPLPTGVPAGD